MLVPSANIINSVIGEVLTISLINKINNRGSKIEPCGTSYLIGRIFELALFIVYMGCDC